MKVDVIEWISKENMSLQMLSEGLMNGNIFNRSFEDNLVSLKNTFKRLTFNPIYSDNFYNPFNLFPSRETFIFHLKFI